MRDVSGLKEREAVKFEIGKPKGEGESRLSSSLVLKRTWLSAKERKELIREVWRREREEERKRDLERDAVLAGKSFDEIPPQFLKRFLKGFRSLWRPECKLGSLFDAAYTGLG